MVLQPVSFDLLNRLAPLYQQGIIYRHRQDGVRRPIGSFANPPRCCRIIATQIQRSITIIADGGSFSPVQRFQLRYALDDYARVDASGANDGCDVIKTLDRSPTGKVIQDDVHGTTIRVRMLYKSFEHLLVEQRNETVHAAVHVADMDK